MDSDVFGVVKKFGIVVGVILALWVTNLVSVIQTIVQDDFVWSEIATFTIIQIAGVVVWPISIVTGPISLFV